MKYCENTVPMKKQKHSAENEGLPVLRRLTRRVPISDSLDDYEPVLGRIMVFSIVLAPVHLTHTSPGVWVERGGRCGCTHQC